MKYFIFLLLSLFVFNSCQNTNTQKIELSFYFWKTNFDLKQEELNYLAQLNIQKMYVRFFDVDFDNEEQKAIPISPIQNLDKFPIQNLKIIPVIFITNNTMKNVSHTELPDLAEKIFNKINHISKKITFQEIQLDCDWTEKSKYNFFDLIREMQKIATSKNIAITSTLRLHQVKFMQKEGIPPVKNTTLMLYNMGNISNKNTKNSIFDLQTTNAYLDKNFEKYPLQMDWALPIFGWGVVKRNGKVVNLLADFLEENNEYIKKIDENQYKVIKSHYKKGFYLYKDDEIRQEKVNREDLKQLIILLKKKTTKYPSTIVLYHFDKILIDKLGIDFLKNVGK